MKTTNVITLQLLCNGEELHEAFLVAGEHLQGLSAQQQIQEISEGGGKGNEF